MALNDPAALTSEEQAELRSEVKYLHQAMFGSEPPSSLSERYLRAHWDIVELRKNVPQQLETVRTIVHKRLNALAIEPWLRLGARRHLLTSKLLLLSYIAECDARHPEIRAYPDSRLGGYLGIAWVGTIALFDMAHGRIQKAWHGLV